MARISVCNQRKPIRIEAKDGAIIWICACGASASMPYCDGAHHSLGDESDGRIYLYEKGKKKEVKIIEKKD